MKEADLTRIIIGSAYNVYNTLGFGFLESVYERSLTIELRRAGVKVDSQKRVVARYRGEIVGIFVADLLVAGRVLVELKSVRELNPVHELQLINYLTATGIEVGLLLNFAQDRVQVRRKVRNLRELPDRN